MSKDNKYIKFIEDTAIEKSRKSYEYVSVMNDKFESAYKEIKEKMYDGDEDSFNMLLNDFFESFGIRDTSNLNIENIHLSVLGNFICNYVFIELCTFTDNNPKFSLIKKDNLNKCIRIIKKDNFEDYHSSISFPHFQIQINEETLKNVIANVHNEKYPIYYRMINGSVKPFYKNEEFLNFIFKDQEINDDEWNNIKDGFNLHKRYYNEILKIVRQLNETWNMFKQ